MLELGHEFTNACRLLNSLFVVNIESCVFPILVTCSDGFLFCKIHANAGIVFPSSLNTHICVKLHANACHYHISKFYKRVITRTVHEYYTQTTRILRSCRCRNPFDRYCIPIWEFAYFACFGSLISERYCTMSTNCKFNLVALSPLVHQTLLFCDGFLIICCLA